jgi:hypothetical protein
MAKTFSVTNPDVFKNALAGLDNAKSESTLRKAAVAGVTVFKDEVAVRVPKKTGDLAAGLSVTFLPENSVDGKIATYKVLFIGDTTTMNAYYKPVGNGKGSYRNITRQALAGWLENGASGRAAEPFVRPAFESAQGKAKEASDAVIFDALKG